MQRNLIRSSAPGNILHRAFPNATAHACTSKLRRLTYTLTALCAVVYSWLAAADFVYVSILAQGKMPTTAFYVFWSIQLTTVHVTQGKQAKKS